MVSSSARGTISPMRSFLVYAHRDMESFPAHVPERWGQFAKGSWKNEELLKPVEDLKPADRARLWELIRARQGTHDRLQFDSHALAAVGPHDDFSNDVSTEDTEIDAVEEALDAQLELEVAINHNHDADHAGNLESAPDSEQCAVVNHSDEVESAAALNLRKSAEPALGPEAAEAAAGTVIRRNETHAIVVTLQDEALRNIQHDAAKANIDACKTPRERRKQTKNDSHSDSL